VRFATVDYCEVTEENKKNVFLHLTNFSLNKDNPNFIYSNEEEENRKSHKRSIIDFFDELRDDGIDTDLIWQKIKLVIAKSICSIHHILKQQSGSLAKHSREGNSFFEILGFDIILDSNYIPYLLEVNHSPSFTISSHVDRKVKTNLIRDTFSLLNPTYKRKSDIIKSRKEFVKLTCLTGLRPTSFNSKIKSFRSDNKEKQLTEKLGLYEHVYPPRDPDKNEYDFELQKECDLVLQKAHESQCQNYSIFKTFQDKTTQNLKDLNDSSTANLEESQILNKNDIQNLSKYSTIMLMKRNNHEEEITPTLATFSRKKPTRSSKVSINLKDGVKERMKSKRGNVNNHSRGQLSFSTSSQKKLSKIPQRIGISQMRMALLKHQQNRFEKTSSFASHLEKELNYADQSYLQKLMSYKKQFKARLSKMKNEKCSVMTKPK